jgi:hypothetical protein
MGPMDVDMFVKLPRSIPVGGSAPNVLYSTKDPNRPMQSGEVYYPRMRGWFKANQGGTVLFQGWDVVTGAWVTLNGTGDVVTSGTVFEIDYTRAAGGDYQIVAEFGTAPTSYETAQALRLTKS